MASQAQIRANQMNAQKSTGPTTDQGKITSRANSFKHGMTGQGIVMPEVNIAEVEDRAAAYEKDLKPISSIGGTLIRRMAVYSLQMDLAARHDLASQASAVRHAVDLFDEARFDEADHLFDTLGENPRKNLRMLCKSPEGIDRLIEGWLDLCADLKADEWTGSHTERAAYMIGLTTARIRNMRLGVLARAASGDFGGLTNADGGNLDAPARLAWSRTKLVEWIDFEIANLKAHRETLDLESIEQDRSGAKDRALFDTSKDGILARRYDAAAQRNFFKALKEFRQVEILAIDLAEAESASPTGPMSVDELGSIRDSMPLMRKESGKVDWEAELAQIQREVAAAHQQKPMGQPQESSG